MQKRFVSIWFPRLMSDWIVIRRPELLNTRFVFATQDHGRKLITALSAETEKYGIRTGTTVADAKAIVADLEVFDDKPERAEKLLKAIGNWCIRFSPIVAVDLPDGLILDVSGCTHLWGDEQDYLREIHTRLRDKGYHIQLAMADTIGTAWALSHFAKHPTVMESGQQLHALLPLPAAALRLEAGTLQRLQKLGLNQISSFINMPRSVLRRRFGEELLLRLSQALGLEEESIIPIQVIPPYQERLPSLEPIRTAKGIEIAIQLLLEQLCKRLKEEGIGLRNARMTSYRIDGRIITTDIGTNRPSHHIHHLFKLFELKIQSIEPALGIDLFVMEATKVEPISPEQEVLWAGDLGLNNQGLTELLDRLTVKLGNDVIHRYLPAEHYWPERSLRIAASIHEKAASGWRSDRPRPTQLLRHPEPVEVTAPIPDYPPMLFRYKGNVHHIKKADGPERIEREWWLEHGEHRDYYQVEDEDGQRYWIFRSGHYQGEKGSSWFIHGYFA